MSTEWLPELLLLEHAGGNWGIYLDRLHARFAADFIDSKPTWPGKRVGVKRHPEYDGKSATFWHLISDGDVEAERLPNMRRCELIGWPRPMMDEFDEADPGTTACRIVWWKESRRNEIRSNRDGSIDPIEPSQHKSCYWVDKLSGIGLK